MMSYAVVSIAGSTVGGWPGTEVQGDLESAMISLRFSKALNAE